MLTFATTHHFVCWLFDLTSLSQSEKLHSMWVQKAVPSSVTIAGAEEDPELVSVGASASPGLGTAPTAVWDAPTILNLYKNRSSHRNY